MVGRATIMAFGFLILINIFGCGQLGGNSPLGLTGGGENGYGSFSGSSPSETPNVQTLIGTWRDNLDSPYYTQYRFTSDYVCEIWDSTLDRPYHAFGTYTVGESYPPFLRILAGNEVVFSGPFWFEGEDLVLGGFGGNFVFHRVG
jgi:hypothetical protein